MAKLFTIAIILIFVFTINGCIIDERLVLLKRLGDNRKGIEKYLDRQEKLFYRLVEDVKRENLKQGSPKDKILSDYCEPIFCKTDKENGNKEYCLFRHPTNYFTSDLVYLYFDEERKLDSWELKTKNETGGQL